MPDFPSGMVTLLFTDIEGSTKRWERLPQAMATVLARHDDVLRRAVESHGGAVFKTVGDAVCAVFQTAPDALAAALAGQRVLAAEAWGKGGPVRVRMALHTGEPQHRDRDYFGPPVNRVARLLSTGYGGQVLLSQATASLVRDHLADGVSLVDLGAHRLKDLLQPERVFQLAAPELESGFRRSRAWTAGPTTSPPSRHRCWGARRRWQAYGGFWSRTARGW